MNKFQVLLLAIASYGGVNAQQTPTTLPTISFQEKEDLFDQFKAKFSKVYTSAKEELKRFKIFMENIEHAERMMINDPTAKYSVLTPFADKTQEEFYQRNGFSASVANFIEHQENAQEFPTEGLPDSYDARDHGLVNPVKNQEQCGSCWAFATVANIEAQNMKVNNKLVSLSEQELVDCSKSDHGCQGGLPTLACKDLIDSNMGLELESAYGYKAVTQKCSAEPSLEKVFLTSYKSISSNEDMIAQALLQYGPLSIGINAQYMQLYTGGISDPFWCPAQLDHGVAIVGFGAEDVKRGFFHWPWTPKVQSKKFWTIRNSWGETWGEKGYYRIVRGKGKCGLNKMVSTSIVKKAGAATEQALFV